mmetsp:Transcript_27183/g.40899  ORF Transcript_27183/g.40899 Transcript_27183/m.40899 type:complete len:128 (+) Transcript_27183:213-596(+)
MSLKANRYTSTTFWLQTDNHVHQLYADGFPMSPPGRYTSDSFPTNKYLPQPADHFYFSIYHSSSLQRHHLFNTNWTSKEFIKDTFVPYNNLRHQPRNHDLESKYKSVALILRHYLKHVLLSCINSNY